MRALSFITYLKLNVFGKLCLQLAGMQTVDRIRGKFSCIYYQIGPL